MHFLNYVQTEGRRFPRHQWMNRVTRPVSGSSPEPRTPYRPVGAGKGAVPPPPPLRPVPLAAGVAPGSLVVPPGRFAGGVAGGIPTAVGAVTVTLVCPLTLPSVAVICAVPGLAPVPFPLASTLATLA